MKSFFKIIIFFSFFVYSYSWGQSGNVLKGKILDASNKEPIPFANISVVNTNIGTISDIDGNFVMKNVHFPIELNISYVGYETKKILLEQLPSKPLKILLKAQTINLPELIIKPTENPAHRIIRQVIENRNRNNPEQLNSFKYVSYNKLIFTIDKKTISYKIDTISIKKEDNNRYKPYHFEQKDSDNVENIMVSSVIDSFFKDKYLFLSESVTRRMFKYPDKNKEVVIATRTSGLREPYFVTMATQFQSFSFYTDYVSVYNKKYLNPLSKQAIGRYFYEIKDTVFSEEGDTIFVIFFRPLKNTLFDGLKGIVQINTQSYAIQTIQAEPAKQNSMMIVSIQQLYRLYNKKQWFPYQLNTVIKMKELSITDSNDTLLWNDTTALVVKKTIPLVGVGKSYIDSVEINLPLESKSFNVVEVELLNDAHKCNDSIWEKYRAENFSRIEQNTYKFIDSVGKEANLDNKIRFIEILLSGYIPIKFLNWNIQNLLTYNFFEGFRINGDLVTNEKISKYWAVGVYAGYGFSDEKWKYGAQFRITPKPLSDFKIQFDYKNDVRETGEISFYDNISLFNSNSYRKFYISNEDYLEQYQLSVTIRTLCYLKNVLSVSRNKLNLSPTNNYVTSNSTYTHIQFNEAVLSTKFLYKEKFFQTLKQRISLGSKYPMLFINVHVGQIHENNLQYYKVESKNIIPISWGVNGKTTLTLMGGYCSYALPISLLYVGQSSYHSKYPLATDNSFNTMRMNEFYYDRFAFAFLKHDFGNILFHIHKFNPGLSIHHNIAIGNWANANTYEGKTTTKPFMEVGIQIYNLFRQSFNGFGIGVFYRYGNYAFDNYKNNLAFKFVLTMQLN